MSSSSLFTFKRYGMYDTYHTDVYVTNLLFISTNLTMILTTPTYPPISPRPRPKHSSPFSLSQARPPGPDRWMPPQDPTICSCGARAS